MGRTNRIEEGILEQLAWFWTGNGKERKGGVIGLCGDGRKEGRGGGERRGEERKGKEEMDGWDEME